MGHSVKFKISDLPPHMQQQAMRQIMTARDPRGKYALPPPSRKQPPIRVPKPPTPNRTESRWLADHPGGLYEALTFRVPSGKYTPDFIHFRPDGRIVAVEVKGGYALRSQAAASAKFKEAVAAYPTVTWVWAKWDGTAWSCGYYGATWLGEGGASAPDKPSCARA